MCLKMFHMVFSPFPRYQFEVERLRHGPRSPSAADRCAFGLGAEAAPGGFQGEMPGAPRAREATTTDLDGQEILGAERFSIDQMCIGQSQYAPYRLY